METRRGLASTGLIKSLTSQLTSWTDDKHKRLSADTIRLGIIACSRRTWCSKLTSPKVESIFDKMGMRNAAVFPEPGSY